MAQTISQNFHKNCFITLLYQSFHFFITWWHISRSLSGKKNCCNVNTKPKQWCYSLCEALCSKSGVTVQRQKVQCLNFLQVELLTRFPLWYRLDRNVTRGILYRWKPKLVIAYYTLYWNGRHQNQKPQAEICSLALIFFIKINFMKQNSIIIKPQTI